MNEVTIRKPSPLEARRAMAQNPRVIGALDGIERKVFQASTRKPFSQYGPEDFDKQLDIVLEGVFFDISYRPAGDTKYLRRRLAEILLQHYPTLSVLDFSLAFELTATGAIDSYFPKNPDGSADKKHYNQFGTEYICKVLNAYKGFRAEVLKKAGEALPAEAPALPDGEKTRLLEETRKGCVRAYDEFCAAGHLPALSPIEEMLYYNLLADAGLAQPIEVSEREKQSLLLKAIVYHTKQGNVYDANRLKKEGINAPDIAGDTERYGRRKELRAAFAKMAKEGIRITDYIKIKNGETDY